MQPLRQDLLELALDYYQEFIDERGEDPELEADLAAAYYRAGEIATALGDETEAQSAHQKALNMRIALANKDPKNTVMRNALAESYISLGRFESTHIDSIDYLTKAIEMAKPLVNPKHRATLVRAYLYLGVMKRRHFRNDGGTEKMEQARTALENAVDVLGELKEDHPEDHQPRLLSEVYTELGTWHQMMGNQDEVKSYDRRTLEISKELVEKEPDNLEHQHTLAGHHANVGEDEKSIKIFEKLANENPSVVLYQGDLAKAYAKLGAIQKDPGKLEESIEIYKRLSRDYPEQGNFPGKVGAQYKALGNLLLAAGRIDEAITAYDSAIATLSELSYYRMELSDAYEGLSRAQNKAGNLAEAIAAQRSSQEVSQKVLDELPDQLHFWSSLAYHRKHLGTLLRRAGKIDEALDAYKSAVELLAAKFADEKSPNGSPGQVRAARGLLIDLHKELADFLTDLDHNDEAANSYRNAIGLASEVIELDDGNAKAWIKRGFGLRETGRLPEGHRGLWSSNSSGTWC